MRSEAPPVQARSWKQALVIVARVGISLLALYILFRFVGNTDLLARLTSLRPGFLALSLVTFAVVLIFSGVRWRVLLAANRVRCSLRDAISLQWAGLFFALFLPGSVGGDALRSVYVARQHGRLAAVAIATIQERVIGLVALLLVGFGATVATRDQLGRNLTGSLLALQGIAVLLALLVFTLAPLVTLARRIGRRLASGGATGGQIIQRLPARLRALVAPLLEPIDLQQVAWMNLMLALLATTLSGLAMYWFLSLALGLTISWLALCVAVPAVTVVRALPISFNGLGVGEGAFIAVLQPFGVAHSDALVLSLTGTAVHAVGGIVGGFFLLWLTLHRTPPAELGTTP